MTKNTVLFTDGNVIMITKNFHMKLVKALFEVY